MEHFEIDTQKTNEQIDFILCQPKKLRIKVIPPFRQPSTYLPDQMIITASLPVSAKTGKIAGQDQVNYDFEIIESINGEVNKDWSMNLFYDAIEYYCQNILDVEPNGFRVANNPKFYPYGGE